MRLCRARGRFAVPQINVLEMVRVRASELAQHVYPRCGRHRSEGTAVCDAGRGASRGWYSDHEIGRGLSPQRFFHREGEGWRVNDSLRALATFERRNLLEPLTTNGKYDVILCRNVAIYFAPAARRQMFERLVSALNPDGYLFVGGQESLTDLGPRYRPHHHCRTVFYRPNLMPS